MRHDELRLILRAQPFRPFTIRTADGREYEVKHPEFMALSPTGRNVVVTTPDDLFEIIDTMMIASVHLGNGKKRTRKRK